MSSAHYPLCIRARVIPETNYKPKRIQAEVVSNYCDIVRPIVRCCEGTKSYHYETIALELALKCRDHINANMPDNDKRSFRLVGWSICKGDHIYIFELVNYETYVHYLDSKT